MMGLEQDYYEQRDLWNRHDPSDLERRRVKETLALIPPDVHSILDAGCGDGIITNQLTSLYPRVIGLDRSQEALRQVIGETVQGSVERIPFSDKSFDVVVLAEVIEHLPVDIYAQCLEEVVRVAGLYIVVTVPHEEHLPQRFVCCPSCGCIYHRYRHVRSFHQADFHRLFKGFRVKKMAFLGGKLPRPYRWEVWMRQHLAGHFNPYPPALCPQCGNKGTGQLERGLLSWILALVTRALPRKRDYQWIGVVYEREKTISKEGGRIGGD